MSAGVSPGTDKTDARRAYRQLVLLYHPDHNSAPDAASKFMAVSSAWEVRQIDVGAAVATTYTLISCDFVVSFESVKFISRPHIFEINEANET